MINKFSTKLSNLFRYITTSIIQMLVGLEKSKIKSKTLLILRTDTIGDYILFRNFLEILRNSSTYKNHHITLCGNVLWKDLAEFFDNEFVDDFIWLERNKFKGSLSYRYKFLSKVRKSGFETVIDPTYTREILFGDQIMRASRAIHRIGSEGAPDKHAAWKRKLFTDKYFTRIIRAESRNMFEFDRNKEFFDSLLQVDTGIKRPFIKAGIPKINITLPDQYAVIFPGAGNPERRWAVENFAMVVKHLISDYNLKIIVAGSGEEKHLARKISSEIDSELITDLTGKIRLHELTAIIAGAVILITNETGASHISAAVRCPFVCISNANHYGRFNPYPDEIFDKAHYVYPPSFIGQINDKVVLEKFRFGSDADINEIKPGEVIKSVDELMKIIRK